MTIPETSYSHSPISTDVEIGNYSSVAEGCVFHGSDNHISVINRKTVSNNVNRSGYTKGKIVIGNDVWIGTNVRILSGVSIGDGAIIGAGAVVAKNIPPFAVAVGNPVVVKRFRFTEKQIKKLLEIQWWNWGRDRVDGAKNNNDFDDIDVFLKKYA